MTPTELQELRQTALAARAAGVLSLSDATHIIPCAKTIRKPFGPKVPKSLCQRYFGAYCIRGKRAFYAGLNRGEYNQDETMSEYYNRHALHFLSLLSETYVIPWQYAFDNILDPRRLKETIKNVKR